MRPSLRSDLAKRTKFAILLNRNTIEATSCHEAETEREKIGGKEEDVLQEFVACVAGFCWGLIARGRVTKIRGKGVRDDSSRSFSA